MKLGIIIICYNIESSIDILQSSIYINELTNLEICLVNNCSDDNTYELLKEVKEQCSNVSVVNIKKFKTENSAVKAGARYMSSQFNLKYIGYINIENEQSNLSLLIKAVHDHQEGIINHIQNITKSKAIKLTMFQSLFSIMEYLSNNKKNIQYSEFQYFN